MAMNPVRPLLRWSAARLAFLAAAWLVLAGRSHAETYGGIEIGGKGVKATVVEVRRGPGGPEVRVLYSASKNTAVTAGLAKTRRFDPAAVKATARAVATFAQLVQKAHELPPGRMHIVGSSGLFSALRGDREAIEQNRRALAEAVRAASGMPMGFINVEQESRLSIDGIIPPDQLNTAVLLDIGGGNTKGGCRTGPGRYVTFGVPFGSVTFADAARQNGKGETFADKAEAARTALLQPALHKSIEGKDELLKRPSVYLSGGACWSLATLMKPADRGSYVRLTAEDIKAYRDLLRKANGKFPEVDLSAIKDEAVRKAAAKEIGKVRVVMKPEQLLAGAEILLALSEGMHLDKARQVSFVRHAQIGWLVAYLLEKTEARRP